MDDDFGASYITIEDDEGNEFELEHLSTLEFEGEEQFASVDDDDLLQRIYDYYMEQVFAEDGEEPPED